MNYYHFWVDLIDSHKAKEFCSAVHEYLGHLKENGFVEGHGLTRRKLGFGPGKLGEFHISIHVKDLVQFESTFKAVANPDEKTARLHANVYSRVKNMKTGLYRDYPDVF